jgi:uncharacterized protein
MDGLEPELYGLAERLARATGAERVVLFGSRAKGEARPDSDIDLLYIVPDTADLRRVASLAQRALWPRQRPFDLVPMRKSHWQEGGSSLARQVAKEGIVLYEA